jgi:hypothetical protein
VTWDCCTLCFVLCCLSFVRLTASRALNVTGARACLVLGTLVKLGSTSQ